MATERFRPILSETKPPINAPLSIPTTTGMAKKKHRFLEEHEALVPTPGSIERTLGAQSDELAKIVRAYLGRASQQQTQSTQQTKGKITGGPKLKLANSGSKVKPVTKTGLSGIVSYSIFRARVVLTGTHGTRRNCVIQKLPDGKRIITIPKSNMVYIVDGKMLRRPYPKEI